LTSCRGGTAAHRDGTAGTHAAAREKGIGYGHLRRAGAGHAALRAERENKNPLQGWLDIGILYSPNSRFDVVTNHPRCFSAINGRKSMAKSKKGKAKKGKAKKSGRKPNPAFMKPMNPTSTLAAVVGSGAMPRTEVTKKIWGYIKRNGLQDKTNRRMINADDKLKAVFGGRSQVSMFEMTRLVNNHLK